MAGISTVQASISIAGSGDNTVIAAPSANQAIHVHYMDIQNTSGTATTVIFKDGTTAFNGAGYLINGSGGYYFAPGVDEKTNTTRKIEMRCSKGNAFVINLSGANQHSGFLLYSLESI